MQSAFGIEHGEISKGRLSDIPGNIKRGYEAGKTLRHGARPVSRAGSTAKELHRKRMAGAKRTLNAGHGYETNLAGVVGQHPFGVAGAAAGGTATAGGGYAVGHRRGKKKGKS